jgi:putative DNA primase/helicase
MTTDTALDMAPKQMAPESLQDESPGIDKAGVTGVASVAPSSDEGCSVTPPKADDVTGVTNPPEMGERPCYRIFEAWRDGDERNYRPGVWHFSVKETRDAVIPVDIWICGPLYIKAITRDEQSNNFGRLLRFKPTSGAWRTWAMPMELLAGDGREMRAELLSMGLEIDPAGRNQLSRYLNAHTPKLQMHCATQVGWCGNSFVLPDEVIGPKAARVVFQSAEHQADEHTTAGTLEDWQQSVAALAPGNPLLLLVLSAGFAGPLLKLCNAESGGLHLTGDSSTGKTAAIEAACSIWGGPGFKRSWRATSNGMEGAAALFNDCLLALDEISECDPREVGAIVYALGNGQGKQRASRTGAARSVRRWRCLVLSNGERTIETAMLEGGYKAKAGQGVRLLDIPASRTFGAWDNLHDYGSGAALSDAIKQAATTQYGQAGRAFLERLTFDARNIPEYLGTIKSLPRFAVEDGQHKRAAARLALIALAGELATEYGITGWQEGEAIEAAQDALGCWQDLRGSGPTERGQVLAQMVSFIDRHGDARFSDADNDNDNGRPVQNRAGWWRDSSSGRQYLFNKDGMREALKGFDFGRALDILRAAEVLTDGSSGKQSKAHRIGGRTVRLYTIDAGQLGAGDGA